MRFSQKAIDRLKLPKGANQRDEPDDDLRGFFVRLSKALPPTYVVEAGGTIVVLGSTEKLPLKIAKPIAAQVLPILKEVAAARVRERRLVNSRAEPLTPQPQGDLDLPAKDPRLPAKLLQYRELAERGIRFTRRHLLNLEKFGDFPRRVRLGERSVGWVNTEIDEYIAQAIKNRK